MFQHNPILIPVTEFDNSNTCSRNPNLDKHASWTEKSARDGGISENEPPTGIMLALIISRIRIQIETQRRFVRNLLC